jgi:hypothetical protein
MPKNFDHLAIKLKFRRKINENLKIMILKTANLAFML